MISIGLAIPSTRFPPLEPAWEFTPLSHEPGEICTWDACETGLGAIATTSVSPPKHIHTHMLGPHACSGLHPETRSPFWGKTLTSIPRAVYPPRFLQKAALRWASVFL
jgi:hypothetical protein